MKIHVVYAAADGTTDNAEFICVEACRQLLLPSRQAVSIVFRGGPAYHGDRKILTAQFSQVTAVFTYDEN